MFGKLIIWGNDTNGFWKKSIPCYQSEIDFHLAKIGDYEDYDFEF
ncbi:hypothetical protein J6TS2_50580 [Heyndrickxia sporothermodurans]|nr:hypothetical protein J6TS2_50580 [Heyndrickxia sporothermodurans]